MDYKLAQEAGKVALLENDRLDQEDDKQKSALLMDDMPPQAFLDDDSEVHIQAQDSLEDCSRPEVCEGVCILKLEADILAYLEDYNSDELVAGILLLVSLEVGSPSLSQMVGCTL